MSQALAVGGRQGQNYYDFCFINAKTELKGLLKVPQQVDGKP
jgi:hypothetical protein